MFIRLAAVLVAVGLGVVLSGTTWAGGKNGAPVKATPPPKTKPVKGPQPHPVLHPPVKTGKNSPAPSAHHKATIDRHVKAQTEKHQKAIATARAEHAKHKQAAAEATKALEIARRKAKTPAEKAALAEHEKHAQEAHERALQAEKHAKALEAAHQRVHEAHHAVTEDQAKSIHSQPDKAGEAIAGELHWVRVLLEKADHDYNGHRAHAVGEISKAIHLLAPKANYTDKDYNIDPWPQAISDRMLRAALEVLARAAAFTTHLPAADHPTQAHDHILKAMHQLEIALTIR
jgi:hypothetical protein